MGGEVGYCANLELLGNVLEHADHIGVVEAEVTAHTNAATLQFATYLLVTGNIGGSQYFLDDRTRVLHVDIDLAGQQPFPQDAGATELPPVVGVGSSVLGELGDHLSQHDRLGKSLGANDNNRAPVDRREAGSSHQQADECAAQPDTLPPRPAAPHPPPPRISRAPR